MSSDIDPGNTALNTFGDLGARVGRFFICGIWGAIIGLFSAWVNFIISGKKEVVQKASDGLEDELYQPVLVLPNMSNLLIAVLGIIPLLYSVVMIIKGSNKAKDLIAGVLGASLLSILVTTKWQWNLQFTVWLNVTVLVILTYWFLRKWEKKQEEAWEAELALIYEENERRREEKLAKEEENAQSAAQTEPEVVEEPTVKKVAVPRFEQGQEPHENDES